MKFIHLYGQDQRVYAQQPYENTMLF